MVKLIALALMAFGACYVFARGSTTGTRYTVIGVLFIVAGAAVSVGLDPS